MASNDTHSISIWTSGDHLAAETNRSTRQAVRRCKGDEVVSVARTGLLYSAVAKTLGPGAAFRSRHMTPDGYETVLGVVYYCRDGRVTVLLDYDNDTISEIVMERFEESCGEWREMKRVQLRKGSPELTSASSTVEQSQIRTNVPAARHPH